jgi:hypothetical protein
VYILTSDFQLSDEGRAYLYTYIKPLGSTVLAKALFKVDSGADLTTISKKELVLLGYSYDWIDAHIVADSSHMLSRAGGNAEPAYYLQLDVLNLLGREYVKWPLYVRKEKHLDFPNLLGVNMLTYYKFAFDYEQWTFLIERIPKPKRLLPMLNTQLVFDIVTS